MTENPRYIRRIAVIATFSMFLLPILVMYSPNIGAETEPELLTGLVYFPQAHYSGFLYDSGTAWGTSGVNPQYIEKYDYYSGDVSNGGWNTNDWRFVYSKDFSNITDYSDGFLDTRFGTLQGSYFAYYDIDSMSDWLASNQTEPDNCTLIAGFAMLFGAPKSSGMDTPNGSLTICPRGIGEATDNAWFNATIWYDQQWSLAPYYTDRIVRPDGIAYAWDDSNSTTHSNPWINFTTFNGQGYSEYMDEADYLAAGGTDYDQYEEPWIQVNPNYAQPDYTGQYGHWWNITEFVTLDDLIDTDFTVVWSMAQHQTGRWIDYLGIWYKFTENIVYDYWIVITGTSSVIMGFIWMLVIFLPAMLLSQIVPKYGFVGGLGLMLILMQMSQTGFLPVFVIGLTAIASIAWKGD